MTAPLSVTWLLEESTVSATVATVCAYADALAGRGHDTRVVTTGQPLHWRSSRAEWVYADRFDDAPARPGEIVVAASWRTLAAALRIGRERALHLCLRDESAAGTDDAERRQIEEALALPIPRLVPAPHVRAAMERFGTAIEEVPVIVDASFFRPLPAPAEELRVLLCGSWGNEVQGVEYGYGAAAHARWFHQRFDLIRVSAWAPSREEPIEAVQEFHVSLSAAEMTRLVHSCHVLVAPNLREEGVSLPVAEAMAAGVPVVASAIPAFAFAPEKDYALFAPEANAVELGERLIEIVGDEALRTRLAARGRAIAAQWREERVAPRLEAALAARG